MAKVTIRFGQYDDLMSTTLDGLKLKAHYNLYQTCTEHTIG